jgi:hypothetical protein
MKQQLSDTNGGVQLKFRSNKKSKALIRMLWLGLFSRWAKDQCLRVRFRIA